VRKPPRRAATGFNGLASCDEASITCSTDLDQANDTLHVNERKRDFENADVAGAVLLCSRDDGGEAGWIGTMTP